MQSTFNPRNYAPPQPPPALRLAFVTRYSFTSRLECTNQLSFHPPRQPALPTLLQYCCTLIGQHKTPLPTWPLQDVVLLQGFCVRINHPFIALYTCITRTIAILLHVYCAIYDGPPSLLLYATYCTISVIAISCQSQLPTSRLYAVHHTILIITISCKCQYVRHRSRRHTAKLLATYLAPPPPPPSHFLVGHTD